MFLSAALFLDQMYRYIMEPVIPNILIYKYTVNSLRKLNQKLYDKIVCTIEQLYNYQHFQNKLMTLSCFLQIAYNNNDNDKIMATYRENPYFLYAFPFHL